MAENGSRRMVLFFDLTTLAPSTKFKPLYIPSQTHEQKKNMGLLICVRLHNLAFPFMESPQIRPFLVRIRVVGLVFFIWVAGVLRVGAFGRVFWDSFHGGHAFQPCPTPSSRVRHGFSVTEHVRGLDFGQLQALPGVFFVYDLSPIKVTFTETHLSFLHFLTNVCAIVGGVFTISGIIDSFIYHSQKAITKKMEIGKIS